MQPYKKLLVLYLVALFAVILNFDVVTCCENDGE